MSQSTSAPVGATSPASDTNAREAAIAALLARREARGASDPLAVLRRVVAEAIANGSPVVTAESVAK